MFLRYLKDWEKSVLERADHDFTVAERNKMMLSAETRTGIEFTGTKIRTALALIGRSFHYNYFFVQSNHSLTWQGTFSLLKE